MEAAIAVRARPGLQTPPKQRDGSARATAGRILRGNSGGGRPGHALHAARAGAHQERQHLRSSPRVFLSTPSFFLRAPSLLIVQTQWSLASGPSLQSHTRTRHAAPRARPLPRPGGKEMRRWDSKGGATNTYGRFQLCATLPGVSHFPGQPRPCEADPQPAREAVCGRPGERALASSAAMPPRAGERGTPPLLESRR